MARGRAASLILGESGDVLLTLVVSMAAVLFAAMVTVDVADWYGLRHQAQLRANAAAMAAANCLAHPDVGAIRCSTPDDTFDATRAARYGTAGTLSGLRINGAPTYVFAADRSTVTRVQVTIRANGSGFFPGFEPKISATATVAIRMPAGGMTGGIELL